MAKMVNDINRVLGIQSRDNEKLLQLGPVFLLIGLAYAAGIVSVQSLFVSRFGVKYLPVMQLIEAGILPLQLWLLSHLSQKLATGNLLKVLYLIISMGVLVCALFAFSMYWFDFQWRMFYPLLFIIVNVLLRILVPLVWLLGDGICLLQQAKRIYPILGALFTLGAILAGLLARILATYFQGFGTELLILLATTVLLSCMFMWHRLIKNYFLSADLEKRDNCGAPMSKVMKTVWFSSFLRISLISFIILLSLFYILDYEFFLFMSAKYPDSDEMTRYFGLFTAIVYTVSLLFGLFLNRLIYTVGIGNTVFLMGVTVLVIFGGTAFMAQSSWALVSFSVGDLMLDVLSFTLLPPISQVFYKLLPAELRAGVSLLFAGSINAVGKLISAGITGLHSTGMVTLLILSTIAFALAFVYFALTWKQNRLYFATLFGSLESHVVQAPDLNDFSPGKISSTSDINPLIEALQSSNPIRETIALELSVHIKHEMLFTSIKPFLIHPDPRKRLLAFQGISHYKKESEDIFLMALQDSDPEIRCTAVRQLNGIYRNSPLLNDFLLKLLYDPSSLVITETIIALYDTADQDMQNQISVRIQAMLTGDDEHRFQVCRAILETRARQYAAQVTTMLSVEVSSRVRISAVKCLGGLRYSEAIPFLLGLYPNADRELRHSIESALLRMGPSAIPEITKGLDNDDTDIWCLSVVSLSYLEPDQEMMMRLSQSCSLKLNNIHYINRIPALLAQEGFKDLSDLYQLRIEENYDLIQKACWRCLDASVDPLIILRLKKALNKTTSTDKREQAIELLTELSHRHVLIKEMLSVFYSDSPAFVEHEIASKHLLNKAMEAFPDSWLNRFSNYVITHPKKGETKMADNKKPLAQVEGNEEFQDMNTMIQQMVLLKKIPLFSQLGISELGLIAKICREELFSDETILIKEGVQNHNLYIIMQGYVEISAQLSEEQQGSLRVLTEPSCLGEDNIFTGNPSPVCAQVIMGNARILTIDGEDLKRLIRLYPEIGIGLLASTSSRLEKLQRMMIKMEQ